MPRLFAARLQLRMNDATGAAEKDYLAAKEDHATAIRARDVAKENFEAAVKRDTQKLAELNEMFEEDHIVFEHLGSAN
jgi:hypothetical protein